MERFISYIQSINQMHWGNGPYQWLFYVGILLIVLFEKNKIAKIIFGYFPIVFILLIYNPLFSNAIHSIWDNPNPYYTRLFSFIPLLYCIAYGIVLVISRTKGIVKLHLVAACCLIVCIFGSDFYHADWMKPVENVDKVPQSVYEVLAEIKKDTRKDICVAFPDPLNVYMRYIDPSLLSPYSRDMTSLGFELSSDTPNVENIMTEAGKASVDYIVVNNHEGIKETFSESGYTPFGETEKHIIYSVSGVTRTVRELNNTRQVISVKKIDKDGNPVPLGNKYYKICYQYDSRGLQVRETYLDKSDEKVMIDPGYSSIERTFKLFSTLPASQIFYDAEDKKALINGRYETRFDYDINKRLIKESYYDINGKLMNRTDLLFAFRDLSYDNRHRIIGEKYFNNEEKPTDCSMGYSSLIREYDEIGNIIGEAYFGVDGEKTNCISGYASVRREYNEMKQMIREYYYDTDDRPTINRSGYAMSELSYDEQGRVVKYIFYDLDGNLALIGDGFTTIIRNYDSSGNISSEEYLNEYNVD